MPPIKAEPICAASGGIARSASAHAVRGRRSRLLPLADARDTPERPRPAVLPIAVTLVAGLLLGFMAGLFRGRARDRPASCRRPPARHAVRPALRRLAAQPPSAAPVADRAGRTRSRRQRAAPHASAAAPPTVPEDGAIPSPRRSRSARQDARRRRHQPATSGRIVVRSSPRQARCHVNGRWRGRTPLTLDGLPFGHYVVRVVQPGYRARAKPSSRCRRRTPRARSTSGCRASRGRPRRRRRRAFAPRRPRRIRAGGYHRHALRRFATAGRDGAARRPARRQDAAAAARRSDRQHVVRLELAEHQAWTTRTRVTAGQESRVTGSLERIQ